MKPKCTSNKVLDIDTPSGNAQTCELTYRAVQQTFAIWPLKSYTVSYNMNGGNGSIGNQIKIEGKDLVLSSTKPTRTGYDFVGWNTNSSTTTAQYQAGGKYTANSGATLYAIWRKIEDVGTGFYARLINTNSNKAAAVNASDNNVCQKSETNSDTQIWKFDKQSDGSYKITNVATNKCLNVSGGIDANGSNVTVSDDNSTAAQRWNISCVGNNYILHPKMGLSKALDVRGVSKDENVNIQIWDCNDLGAQYFNIVKVTYTISYNMNGGSGSIANQTKTYGQDLTLSSTKPTRTGYDFVGWNTNASATTAQYQAGGKYTANSGATLYAIWKANTYTVSYNMNGGSGSIANQTKTYGQDLTLSSTKPTRTGYDFVGWNTSASATTAQYQAGGKYTANSGATLYAIWKANTYTVSYNMNGGSGSISNQTKTYGQDLTLSSTKPIRTGYTFIGWNIDKNSTTAQYQPGDKYTANNDATLYAIWRYTISYDMNGGTGIITNQTKAYKQDLTLSTVIPTRENYTFIGWNTDKDSELAEYHPGDKYTTDKNTILYAIWKNNTVLDENMLDLGEDFYANIKFPLRNLLLQDINGKVGLNEPSSDNSDIWHFVKQSDGGYTIQNTLTEKYFDVQSAKNENGTNVLTYEYHGGKNQIWYIYSYGSHYVLKTSLSEQKVLDIDGGSIYAQIWKCGNNNTNQQFDIIKYDLITVKYDFNGGNGNVNKQEKIYKKDLTLSNTTPTRTDYEFIGWSTNKNATVAQYQAGDKYTANSDATLYAIWKVNHNYTTKMIAPTCTEKGYTLYTCTNCGNSYKESYTNATGHKYVNEVIEATTAEQGYTLHTCSVCDHFYKDNYTNKLLTNTSTLSATAIILGNTIKVTATATGGTGEYQYQVVYKQKAQTKWTTAQAYKANANISFKPGKATSYDVCVKVKDNKETEVKKFFTVIVNDVLKNNSTVSSTTINLGNTVTVTAKATGGAGNYTYGVYYKKTSDTKWITKQNFKTNEKVTIKPAKATTYDICIKVKDGNGTTVKKYFKVNVTQLINISTLSATSIKLGDTIQVSCFARGSTGFYQYAVYYKKTSDTKWTTKQNYSANYTASIKPAKATTYDICVKVKDNLNNESKKYFTVIVK